MIELREFQEIKRKICFDQVKIDKNFALIPRQRRHLKRRNCEVINFTWSHVKNNSKLANLMKLTRIEGHNGIKGRIHRKIRKFMMISSKLIKSEYELMIKIGENVRL